MINNSTSKYPEISWEFSIHPMLNKKSSFKKIHLRQNHKLKSLNEIDDKSINYETYITINYILQKIQKIENNKNYLDLTVKEASDKILKQLKNSKNIWELALYQKIKIAELEARSYKLQKESLTDPLTKLANRRLVDSKLDELINNFSRNPQEFSIFILDIDFFKKINDTFWHDVWDIALKWLANILNNEVRAADTVARWWWEEFLIILKWTTHNIALEKAEQIRKKIETELIKFIKNNDNIDRFCPNTEWCSLRINCQRNNLQCFPSRITCSIWVSTIKKENWEVETKSHLIKRADSALYIAKENWRNMVYSWRSLEIPKKED